ncbi:MAG: toll/interleukin-1 receptor domain-containing protein [Acidobacteria bacterium]|nr:toll/interleukin-1 receptor domain-containing protein [Acidobacteriota bacterium]
MSDKPKVFLSYAREDSEPVRKIFRYLSDQGFRPWMDTERLPGGVAWWKDIQHAIKQSDFFVICLSPRSVAKLATRKRNFLKQEVEIALKIQNATNLEIEKQEDRIGEITNELAELARQSSKPSKASLKTKNKEFQKAIRRLAEKKGEAIFVIPIRLADCELPKELKMYQAVDCSDLVAMRNCLKAMLKEKKKRNKLKAKGIKY